MSTIYKDYGSGGSGLTSKAGTSGGSGSNRHPAIADVLRDVADDLTAINTAIGGTNITSADPAAITAADPAAITAADPTAIVAADPSAALGAFTDPPSAGEMATLRTLVNELRDLAIDFKARFAEYRTLDLDVKARLAELRTLDLDVKARLAEDRTLVLELKTDVSAATGGTLKTIKG